jgi:hypothetical protein
MLMVKRRNKRSLAYKYRGPSRAQLKRQDRQLYEAQKKAGNPSRVKMRRPPKGWIKAKAVRVVTRGGKRIVEVKR